MGVASSSAQLHAVGYASLIGQDEESWGWDLGTVPKLVFLSTFSAPQNCNRDFSGRNKLYHNTKRSPPTTYPSTLLGEDNFVVPDSFLVALDMDEGTLSFVADGQFLGIAVTAGVKGKTLFPIVSAVWGHCEVTIEYLGGLDRESLSLLSMSRELRDI